MMRCPVSYYTELKGRQARVNILGSSSTIRQYRRRLLFTRASLAFLNMLSNPRIELGFRRSGRTAVYDSLRLKKNTLHLRNRSIFSGRKLGLYQHFARRSIYSPMGIHRLFSFERELDGNAPISVRVIARYHSLSQFTIDARLHGTRTDHFFGPEARTISTIGHRTLNF